jgi:hypothetical protein
MPNCRADKNSQADARRGPASALAGFYFVGVVAVVDVVAAVGVGFLGGGLFAFAFRVRSATASLIRVRAGMGLA